jgi:hypothetical protein
MAMDPVRALAFVQKSCKVAGTGKINFLILGEATRWRNLGDLLCRTLALAFPINGADLSWVA